MTEVDLQTWRAFCEWLDERKYKCAWTSDVPTAWRSLVYVGGYAKGQWAREARHAAGVIFYQEGWGWRLRKNWRERLAELEALQET